MNKLNPNHPVTQAMDGQWLKILAIFMHMQHVKSFVIDAEDIHSLPEDVTISIQELPDGIHIKSITMKEAQELARKEGGMPV
jgi:hypothetical protein